MAKKQAGFGSTLGQSADYFGAQEVALHLYGVVFVFCSKKISRQHAVITYSSGIDFALA